MKQIMKTLAAAAIVFLSFPAFSQPYKHAIGLRIAGTSSVGGAGVTYKYFLNESRALEGIFSFKDPVALGAMYQVHNDWNILSNLRWYYGGGAFISFSKPDAGFGAMGVIGVDYKFDNLPLNLALDWKPEIAFAPKTALNFNTFGLSLRVVLGKNEAAPVDN